MVQGQVYLKSCMECVQYKENCERVQRKVISYSYVTIKRQAYDQVV